MLPTKAARTFSTSQLPKLVRSRQVFRLLTSKRVSHQMGALFVGISNCKSGPSMVCFVPFDFEMCFGPQLPAIFHLLSGQMAPHPSFFASYKSLAKQNVSRLCYLFAHLHLHLSSDPFSSLIFFLHLFSSLTLPISAFHLPILSVGSLTCKLPSISHSMGYIL